MKALKAKVSAFAICSSLMLLAAAGEAAAASAETSNASSASVSTGKAAPIATISIPQTNVNGVNVPGIYVVTKDSKVAFIPGIGLVVVDKSIPLPSGAYYVKNDR
ncbi:hypothetical protein [Paenibacillus hamazuiensis]|uniref:hypothetical protein n=1 Tax=Paenibacillus hamazuiensis TaxID=2936508 RepID=UPI00200CCF2B|nr:hypothetical protein [Paenibacillus hamazuiensis]